MLAFISCLLIPVLLLGVYIGTAQATGNTAGWSIMLLLAGGGMAAAFAMFFRIARTFRRRFYAIVTGMDTMLKGGRRSLQSKMSVTGTDELGQLGATFNELQDYVAQRYSGMEQELQLAYNAQQNLLPGSVREIAGFGIAAACRQTWEVGGDFYDIVQLGESRVAVFAGDVAGKGLQAALVMSAMMALFRREIRKGGSAGEVLSRLNRMMFKALQGQLFVTAGLAILNRDETAITYASAGHMPPYVLRGGTLEELEPSSLPLGIRSEVVYQNHRIDVPSGSRLVLFSDGMVESDAPDGKMIGFDRFKGLLLELNGTQTLARLAEALMEQTEQPRNNGRSDDRTVVLIERKARASGQGGMIG